MIKQTKEMIGKAGGILRRIRFNGSRKGMEEKFSNALRLHRETVQEIADLVEEECPGCNPGSDGDGITS